MNQNELDHCRECGKKLDRLEVAVARIEERISAITWVVTTVGAGVILIVLRIALS